MICQQNVCSPYPVSCGLVEPHEVCTGPPLRPVKVFLDGVPSLQGINCTTAWYHQQVVEGLLDPTVCVIDKDITQYWSHYGPLRGSGCYWLLLGT